MHSQLDLFGEILATYRHAKTPISNDELYKKIQSSLGLNDTDIAAKVSAGKAGLAYNLFKRKCRWYQQTLKQAGILERVEGKRGEWCITKKTDDDLDKILPSISVLGFSTELGLAVIGYSEKVFAHLQEDVHLVLTSPPFPLSNPRKYGNVKEHEYVDWFCKVIEPVISKLAPGASVCLNLGQDIFMSGSPARSMYIERLLLALHDRFSLDLMDRLIWRNASKPPGPIAWASKKRVQLNVEWEGIYWLTNDPMKVLSNNRRVLEPHKEKHLEFILNGGAKKSASKSDGAYTLKEGSYGNLTEGRIPRNVLDYGHSCSDNRNYRKEAIAQGLVPHGATMPLKLVKFLIEFLTEPNHLVVDNFAGSMTTGRAAEDLGRRWYCVDPVIDYVMGGANRFKNANGFVNHLV